MCGKQKHGDRRLRRLFFQSSKHGTRQDEREDRVSGWCTVCSVGLCAERAHERAEEQNNDWVDRKSDADHYLAPPEFITSVSALSGAVPAPETVTTLC